MTSSDRLRQANTARQQRDRLTLARAGWVSPVGDRLTQDETQELEGCEEVIENGIKIWYQVGEALLHIRDKRLYRANYKTFEDYCQDRWQMTRRYSNYLIQSSEVYANLGTLVPKEDMPTAETQVRPLTSLEPEEQEIVWDVVVQTAPGGKVTAAHVKSVVSVLKEVTATGAIDDGTGVSIPVSEATITHVKAAVTEETYERLARQETHVIEKLEKQIARDERKAALDQAAARAGRVTALPTLRIYATGEIVKAGRHTLICADNRDVAEYLKGLKADFVFADPPYNANAAAYDDGTFEWNQDFLIECAPIVAVTPGISSIQSFMVRTTMPYKWSTSCYINNGMTRGALGFGNWIYTALFTTDSLHRNAQDVTTISISSTDKDETSDKRQKPPRYLAWLFNLLVPKGGLVIDAFGGSGIAVLVADQLGMTCVSIEKDPATFAAMVARVEKGIGDADAI